MYIVNGIITTASAPAVAPATVVVAGGGYAAQGSYAQPRYTGERVLKGHIGFGPGVYTLKPKDGDSQNHNGAVFGGGWNVFPSDLGQIRLNFDLGLYYWSEDEYRYEEQNWALPVTFGATYEFNLGSPKFRARAGLVLGETLFVRSYDNSEDSESAAAFVSSYGGEFGLAWTPGRSFHLDLSFRVLTNTKAKYKFDNFDYEMKSTAQQWTLALGWRF